MEALLMVLIGIGLAATCGFRIFIPLLGLGLAAQTGHITLAEEFTWIGSWPAIVAFGVAAGLEIGAYYIPWLDNFLDSIASPAAVIAGIMVSAAVMTDMSPLLQWSLAIIAGGGAAAAVQGITVVTRGASTATTGGAANPVVSTGEAAVAVAGTTLSLTVPVIAVALLALFIAYAGEKVVSKLRKPKTASVTSA